jgi:hypothetical protein
MQGLDALERDVMLFDPNQDEACDLGHICAGVTLGWLELREAVGDVRAGRPNLFRWYDAFRKRPSMQSTEPH